MTSISFNQQNVTPKMILVIYNTDTRYYVESHNIILHEDNQYKIAEGKPLYLDTLREMVTFFEVKGMNKFQFKGIIPKNILYIDVQITTDPFIIWTEPIGVRTINRLENHDSSKPEKITIDGEDANIVYVLRGDELEVYLEKEGKLYVLPLPNIYTENNVCMGSWLKKKGLFYIEDIMRNWASGFWEPNFTEFHTTHKFDPWSWWKEKDYKKLKQAYASITNLINKKTHHI